MFFITIFKKGKRHVNDITNVLVKQTIHQNDKTIFEKLKNIVIKFSAVVT